LPRASLSCGDRGGIGARGSSRKHSQNSDVSERQAIVSANRNLSLLNPITPLNRASCVPIVPHLCMRASRGLEADPESPSKLKTVSSCSHTYTGALKLRADCLILRPTGAENLCRVLPATLYASLHPSKAPPVPSFVRFPIFWTFRVART
jgi:hypothetical protein